jgi:hypothetical protein
MKENDKEVNKELVQSTIFIEKFGTFYLSETNLSCIVAFNVINI